MPRSSAGIKHFPTLEQSQFSFLQHCPWSPHDLFIEGATLDRGHTAKENLQIMFANNNTLTVDFA